MKMTEQSAIFIQQNRRVEEYTDKAKSEHSKHIAECSPGKAFSSIFVRAFIRHHIVRIR